MEKLNFNRLILDKPAITKVMDVGEFLFTLTYILGYRMEDIEERMLEENSAKFDLGKIVPSAESIEKAMSILRTARPVEMDKDEMLTLAKKLKEMFPQGIMIDGIPWTEGPMLIVQRLEGFFRKFGNYSAEDIENAMLRYVTAKRGSPFMKSLKNAIYKEVVNVDGTVELQSDLYNYLEN